MQATSHPSRNFRIALACIAAITVVRIIVLLVSPLELYPDEAQYWWWAQSPALGYFSKPPMIAWIVWATTTLFGNAEWAIRLAAPLLHGAAALCLFGFVGRIYDSRIGLISALAYVTTPGASYSSGLISTDVPLLLCWVVALYAFWRALDDRRWRWPLLCGLAIGVGLLSKYAMLYFLLGAAVAALLVPRARRFILSGRGAVVVLIGLLVFAPNIWWNAQHGFPTVTHTESNANWGHSRFNPLNSAAFFVGQFGVFGPLLMAGYLAALWRLARAEERSDRDLVLAAFSAPPLALMLVQSFIVAANANWAATTYVAATPLAVCELVRWWRDRALWASFAINGLAMVLLWIFVADPGAAERAGLGNAFKREQGWRPLGQQVIQAAGKAQFDAVATDNRSVIAELVYYARPCPTPLRVLSRNAVPRDHYQMTIPLLPGTARVLLVIAPADSRAVLATFDSAMLTGTVATAIGGRHQRVTQLYDARHYRGF